MLSKLLVPVDGSENSLRALDHAIYLAKKTGANTTAMNVIENPPTVYVESQKLIMDDGIMVVLGYPEKAIGALATVENLKVSPVGAVALREVDLTTS